jgi:isopenicillin N synthase-like dioxygenase
MNMNMGSIPVINICHLERPETLRALDVACREWGFFQVVDHGVHGPVVDDMQQAMCTFFAQPTEQKRRISRTLDNPWGFYDQELTKNTLDWKEIYDYGPADHSAPEMTPQWPQGLPDFQSAILAYYAACETLSFRLLGAISTNLGMPAEHLNCHYQDEHSSFVRLNYYPRCPQPARPAGLDTPTNGHLGINHHTDAGALTILFQDAQPGLEVFRKDHWHLVRPVPGALVVNIGDIVQVWSNDRYRAALHRVQASAGAERFSAPFFFNPAYATNYAPLPTTVDYTHPPCYRSINWGEFRAARATGDYGDLGEEVQISQYRMAR